MSCLRLTWMVFFFPCEVLLFRDTQSSGMSLLVFASEGVADDFLDRESVDLFDLDTTDLAGEFGALFFEN